MALGRAETGRPDRFQLLSGRPRADGTATCVYLTPNLDEAIWDAELAVVGPGRST
jgi:hypothetical protein